MATTALINPLIDATQERRRGSSWWRTVLVRLALGMLAFLVLGQGGFADWWVPGEFLVASGVALLPPIYRALSRRTIVVLADQLLVLAIAFSVYLVVGAMLVPVGDFRPFCSFSDALILAALASQSFNWRSRRPC